MMYCTVVVVISEGLFMLRVYPPEVTAASPLAVIILPAPRPVRVLEGVLEGELAGVAAGRAAAFTNQVFETTSCR